jgi:hypothetical protein
MNWTGCTNVLNELKHRCYPHHQQQQQHQPTDKQLKAYNTTIERIIDHIQWFRKNKEKLIDTNEKSIKRNLNINLTRRITLVLSCKQPSLEIISEILAIKKEMDQLKSMIKKDILQQQLVLLSNILNDISMNNNIPIKKVITILQCMHGICEDRMWSDTSTNARKMINKYINNVLSSSSKLTETMTGSDRLSLTSRLTMIHTMLSALAENSNIGIKRSMVNNDDNIYLKKRTNNCNWFSL